MIDPIGRLRDVAADALHKPGELLRRAATRWRTRRVSAATLARRMARAKLTFPEQRDPVVSVLIAMHGRPEITLDALVALMATAREAAIEVLLCDDHGPDDSGRFFARVPGLRLTRNTRNIGYLRTNNRLAAEARGEFLLLLNNDTVIQPGALTALLDVFRAHPDAGLVGARLLFPDGRLQEAGAEVLPDGRTVRRGWRQRDRPGLHDVVEEVDYCSAAGVLIPRSLFLGVGGFDERYLPAYYEDVDLAFKVRETGRKVYFQPAARILHIENASSDFARIKAQTTINRPVFRDRWRTTLDIGDHPSGRRVPVFSPCTSMHASPAHPRHPPLVTVVVPTYGRPDHLRACLKALAAQTLAREAFEVVVVDDGGPDRLGELVGEFAEPIRLRLIRQDNAGPAAARNAGVRIASGDLVALTDDDCLPDPGWLETLVEGERKRPGALVGGSTRNGLGDRLFSEASQWIIDMVYDHFNADPENAYFFASNNVLFPRSRYLEIGGFDASFPKAGAEDRDFCDRWRAAGWPLIWRPQATIEHHHPQSLRSFIDVHCRYGRGAHRYHARRRQRASGTMRDDLSFHATLPRRVWKGLGRYPGVLRKAGLCGALALWQCANAAGFFAESLASRTAPSHDR